jgi:Domain of unknown function (DUF4124)
MKKSILFVALILISASAGAEVYKCKTPGGVVYSEQPCAGNATVVNNLTKNPSDEDVSAAKIRLSNDMHQIAEKEKQTRLEQQDRDSRQGTRVVAIVVVPRSTGTTIVQSYGQNQNVQAAVPQTTSKTTNNHTQASKVPR